MNGNLLNRPSDAMITLSEAAKLTPGNPSSNALWRWCRNGVKVRGAERRVRLKHVRAGGRVLTSKAWIDEFMLALSEADLAHFEAKQPPAPAQPPTKGRTPEARDAALAAANAIFG